MKTLENIKALNISARLWFDKINGNTYHAVRVHITYNDDTDESLSSGVTYGYDNHWDQTAMELVVKHLSLDNPKHHNSMSKYPYLTRMLKDKGITFSCNVHDEVKYKELKQFAKN